MSRTATIRHARDRVRQIAGGQIDFVLLAVVVVLCLFGLLMLYDASVVKAAQDYNDKFHFVTQQATFLALGMSGMVVASKIDYHLWRSMAPLLLIGGFVLLLAVFIPGMGVEVLGAKRWLNLGVNSLTLQPSYLMCFALIAYLASWLGGDRPDKYALFRGYTQFVIILGLVLLIVAVFQKDLGSTAVLALTSLVIFFLAGAPLWQVGLTVIGGAVLAVGMVLLEPYRMGRVMSFIDPSHDELNTSYHITQALIALGSGGWLGLGIGQSRQKYSYLPEVQTDSIFAIIGEELGYIGVLVLVSAFVYLIWRGMQLAMRAPDMFGRLLVGGIMALIGIQVFINLFAISGIIPLTGIPLPFFSSGGTSLIVLLFSIGIVLNVSKKVEAV